MPTYTAPTTRASGFLVTASVWNTDIVENIKYFKDAPVFDTAVIIGAATTAGIRLDLESGTLAVREGDDSAYAPLIASIVNLPSGGSVNFASGDVTITHSTNTLTFAGASSGYVFDDHLKLTVGKYIDWGTTVGSFGGRFGRYLTGSFLIGVPGTSSSESFLVVNSAGVTIAEFRGDQLASFAGNIAIGATARLYLDGLAGTGNTYQEESAADVYQLVVGGTTKLRAAQTGISVSTSATTILAEAGGLGSFVVVNGNDGSNRFCDLVLASTATAPTVVSSYTSLGSPAARTYTRSGDALQLAMASGTYAIHTVKLGS